MFANGMLESRAWKVGAEVGPPDLEGASIIDHLSCRAVPVVHSGHTEVTVGLEAGLWKPCLKPAPRVWLL